MTKKLEPEIGFVGIDEAEIKWGEIYFADLGPISSFLEGEIGGKRPVLVVQNNTGNAHAPSVTVVPLTSSIKKLKQPTHLLLRKGEGGTLKDSIIVTEQVKTISKKRLKFYMGKLDKEMMKLVMECIAVQIGAFYVIGDHGRREDNI